MKSIYIKNQIKPLLITAILLLCYMAGYAQWNTWCYVDYTSNGTFTVPANCTEIYIEAIGGGGGGGNAVAPVYHFGDITYNQARVGTGGGGGGYSRKHISNPSGNYTIVIGSGGNSASDGNATTVTGNGCNISANGGKAGTSTVRASSSTGAGGTASGGDCNKTGGRGGTSCDNRRNDDDPAHDKIGAGSGGGAAGGDADGGTSDQSTSGNANQTPGYGKGGANSGIEGIGNWLKGGNGGSPKNSWNHGNPADENGYGGGGAGARTKKYEGDKTGGAGRQGIVRIWFHIVRSDVTLSVSPTNNTISLGESQTITTSVPNHQGTVTYKWSNDSTNSSITVTPSSTKTYTVTITDKNAIGKLSNGNACAITRTASSTITVVSFSAGAIATTGQTRCLSGGTNTTISNTTSPVGSSVSYKWKRDGADIPGTTAATYKPTDNAAGSHTYTRWVKDSYNDWTQSSGQWVLTIADISNVKPTSREYVACPNEEVQIDLLNLQSGCDYAIYTSASGSTFSATDHHHFKKTNTSTEVAYIQILANGSPVCDRIAVNVLPSDFCGSETDQNCDGLVLFNEDFGGNAVSDPQYSSTPNPNVNSTMAFASGTEAGSGKYGLTKHAVASYCIPDNTDHTHLGDQTKGYFMMIDPTDGMDNSPMYETTISNLCSGSPLTFSFWASELHKESDHVAPPKFDLQLINPANNEVLVQSSIWTPAATDQQSWHQYGLRYTVPSDISSVKFRISNRSNAYVGNDYRIDDIKVIFCGGTITQSNTDINVCAGSSVSMTNTVNLDAGSGITSPAYKWQYSTDGSSWQTISGANAASYTISSVQSSNAGYYRMFVADASTIDQVPDGTSCMLQTPTNYHITVTSPSVGGTVSSNQTICSGGSVSALSLSGNTGSVSKWQYSTDNSNWTDISNTSTTLPAASMSTTQSRWYRAVVKNGVCAATNSSSAKVSLYPTFSAGSIASTGETICKNGTPSAIGSTTAASGGNGSITYKWQVSTNSGSYTDIASTNSATFTPSAYKGTGGTYTFKRLAKDGACHTDWAAASNTYTLTVKAPAVTLNDISASASTVCKGSDVTLTASTSSSTGTVTYKWSANNSTANPLTVNPTAQTTYTVTATASESVTTGTCTATATKSKTINVYPDFSAGAIASTGEEITEGETASEIGSTTAATGGNGSISYQWFAEESLIEGATSASYTPGETYTGVPGTYTFTRKAKDGACADWTLSENSYVLTVTNSIFEAVTDRGNIASCGNVEYNESFIDQNGQKVNRPAMSQYGELLNSSECDNLAIGAVTKTDSSTSSLTISAAFTADKAVTSGTICAYTDADCTTPAGTCATIAANEASPVTGTITGLTHNSKYYVKVTINTANGTDSKIAGPFGTHLN